MISYQSALLERGFHYNFLICYLHLMPKLDYLATEPFEMPYKTKAGGVKKPSAPPNVHVEEGRELACWQESVAT
jgi:hypothetical protein